MAKFLQKYSTQNIKATMDKRIAHATNLDTDELIKFMSVKSESDGLRKLFRMLGVLDLMLTKLTEYQTVAFLKYDKVYEDLKKQFGGPPSNRLTTMDSGFPFSPKTVY